MKKLVGSFLLAFFILSSITLAQDFSIDIDKKEYYTATYTDYVILKVNNYLSYEDWFSISVIGSETWVEAESSSLRVPGFGSEQMRIRVEPPKDVIPLYYPYQYYIKVERISTGEVLEKTLLLRVKQITNALIKDFKLSCAECLDEIEISGTIYNVGSESVDLLLILKTGEQTKTIDIGLIPIFGRKEFETTFSLKDWQPGDYAVEAKLIDADGRKMYEEFGSFKIPLIENLIYDKDVSSTIFGSTITVTATNKGNDAVEVDLESVTPKAWYSIYSGPSPTGMAIGDHYLWQFILQPEETKSITYSEIYWPTYVIIFFIIAIVGLVYWQTSPFDFSKVIHGRRRIKSGKDISVSLHLKNKGKAIDRAVVKDVVPPGFAITSKFETVKPVIRKIGNGVELNWKVGKLKPHEERVLHYTIKPTEVGKRKRLPSAKVRALSKKKIVSKRTKKISLGSEKKDVKYVSVKVNK